MKKVISTNALVLVICAYTQCFISMFDIKQKRCVKHIHLVTDDGFTTEKLFIK